MFSLTACLAFLENEKDEEAFLRYYERYHRLVLYEAEKIVGPSAAEDVMQNTFVYIAKHFSTFRSGSSKKVTHLAALCARRRALDYLRRDAKQAGHPAGEPPDEDTDSVFADASLDTERLVMTADRLEHAIAVVDSLPEIYRDTTSAENDRLQRRRDLRHSRSQQDHGVQTASARLSHGAGKDGEER